jgi:hypothetical protein
MGSRPQTTEPVIHRARHPSPCAVSIPATRWFNRRPAHPLSDRNGKWRANLRRSQFHPANDAIERPHYLTNLALVYAMTGETEKAVTLVEQLLITPSVEGGGVAPITLTQLRSWKWDSLRSNLRFQKILAGPEPKTIY